MRLIRLLSRAILSNGGMVMGVPKFDSQGRLLVAAGDGLVGGIDFSMSEQDTGLKWTDGRAIYQKSIFVGTGLNNNTLQKAHGISDLDIVIDMWGSANVPGVNWAIIPFSSTTSTNIIEAFLDGTNANVSSTGNWESHLIHLHVLYVKS